MIFKRNKQSNISKCSCIKIEKDAPGIVQDENNMNELEKWNTKKNTTNIIKVFGFTVKTT